MFRRGRYQQLKNAEADEDENNRLEFVGTSSELFSPKNGEQHSKTPISTANTKTSVATLTPKNGIATDDQLTKVIGILYFMSWTRKALKNYSNEIRKLYEIPLTERCFGKFDESKNSTEVSIETSDSRMAAKDLAKKLEKGSNVTETFTDLALITKRVADALANPTKDFIENRAETPRHLITPIEIASLSRLRTLKDFIRYLQPYERPRLQSYNSKLNIPENVKVFEYIGKLEAILNHHRTILHIIGSSTISIFQIILKSCPIEILETTTRSLREVAHKLPPSFRFYDDLKLSSFATNFLNVSPPNSIEFSMGEIEHHQSTAATTEASTPVIIVKSSQRQHQNTPQSRKSSIQSVKSDNTQRSESQKSPEIKSPEMISAEKTMSTQRPTASNQSPPTARN
uniref:Uncharacterized protein n=1 Tax=Panagrolaimus davidi TaxID=227884 RepID=A0A914PN55_9BILA